MQCRGQQHKKHIARPVVRHPCWYNGSVRKRNAHCVACATRAGTVSLFPAGVPIPKDTRLMYNIYNVNHDPKLWTDHEVFRPERFLDPVTGKLASKDRLPPLLSFGLGPRTCPGEKLAQADMFYVLVRLMQRLSVAAPDGALGQEVAAMGHSFFLIAGRQNVVLTKSP